MKKPNSLLHFILLLLLAAFPFTALHAQWEPVRLPGNESAVKIYNLNNVWVAQAQTGCYRSIDDGISWQLSQPLNDFYTATIYAEGNDLYLVSVDFGLIKSSDQGLSWQTLNTEPVDFYPGNLLSDDQYFYFNTYHSVFRYDKNNIAAEPVKVFDIPNPVYPTQIIMAASHNTNTLWIALRDSLMRSTDAGNQWELVHQGYSCNSLEVQNDTIMLSVLNGVLRSTDGGVTWDTVLHKSNTYDLQWFDGRWIAGVNNTNYLWEFWASADGGNNWQPFAADLFNESSSCFAKHGNTILSAGITGIARSTDEGQHWDLSSTGLTTSNSSLQPHLYQFDDDMLFYGKNLSENEAETWHSPINFITNRIDAPYIKHGNNYYAFDHYWQLYRTDSSLLHWQNVGDPLPWLANTAYRIFSTGNHFYRLDYQYGVANTNTIVYESTDEGQSWTPTGGTTKTGIIPSHFTANNNYFFEWRGGFGLFRSSDGGINWESVGEGLDDFDTSNIYGARLQILNGVIFLTNQKHIAISTNEGLSFSIINKHLKDEFGETIGANALIYDGNILITAIFDKLYMSPGLTDDWFEVTGNLSGNTFFYEPKMLVHRGFVYIDNGLPVWRRPLASFTPTKLSGLVYHDDNNNGQQDPGEAPFAAALVSSYTGTITSSADDGTYELRTGSNQDTVRIQVPAPWVIANPPYYVVDGSANDRNFGLYFPPNITDGKLDLTNYTVFRPGVQTNICLNYNNLGTLPIDGAIRFVASAPLQFVSADIAPDGNNGDTLYWNISDLTPFTGGKIVLTVSLPANTPLGSLVNTYARFETNQTDANFIDNQYVLQQHVVGSYDPNDKQCDHTQITPEQVAAREALTYTIRFQNTGTSPADFVIVTDTLDFEHLDVSTLQILSTSHPCETQISGRGIVEFIFNPINLLPKELDEAASQGFIKYSIKPQKGLALNQQIRNTAYIYFDYNEAIVTNTVETKVAYPVASFEPQGFEQVGILQVLPNPNTGFTRIETGLDETGNVWVFDATGRLVAQLIAPKNGTVLDLSRLAQGTYLVEWRGNSGVRKIGKLVRI